MRANRVDADMGTVPLSLSSLLVPQPLQAQCSKAHRACTQLGSNRRWHPESASSPWANCDTSCTGLHRPSSVKAHKDLVLALEGLHTWEEHQRRIKELLKEMLQSRSEVAWLSRKYDIWWVPDTEVQRLAPLSM